MTRNPITDGETVLAPLWGSMMNAHGSEAILNGVEPSVGTGDWDVDTTNGEALIGDRTPTVSASTTTLTDPANDPDLDSGEFRVDLLTVNSSGTINVAEGAAAPEPITPDIPTDEAVVCAVVISADANSLQGSDIRDYRTIKSLERAPIYGDGSDGDVTRTSDVNESGVIYAENYEVTSGTTVDVANGILVVFARGRIVINGTLTATGRGGSGGSGGDSNDLNGDPGSNGVYTPLQSGGAGGTAPDAGDGGSGGDGDTNANPLIDELRSALGVTDLFQSIRDNDPVGAGGGGGGASFEDSSDGSNTSGGDGSFPGGGGGGAEYSETVDDGFDTAGEPGGDGGGAIMLVAPSITGNGSIIAEGQDGDDSADVTSPPGAGGGGTGGFIAAFSSRSIDQNSLTFSVSGGLGGSDASIATGGGSSGAGADGADGILIIGDLP